MKSTAKLPGELIVKANCTYPWNGAACTSMNICNYMAHSIAPFNAIDTILRSGCNGLRSINGKKPSSLYENRVPFNLARRILWMLRLHIACTSNRFFLLHIHRKCWRVRSWKKTHSSQSGWLKQWLAQREAVWSPLMGLWTLFIRDRRVTNSQKWGGKKIATGFASIHNVNNDAAGTLFLG